jgi:hypothetical protein
MTKKTMWAIASGEYSDYSVSAVFATEELAEQAVEAANQDREWDRYRIEELPYFDRPARTRVRYTHSLMSDGNSAESGEVVPEWSGWGEEIQGFTWAYNAGSPYVSRLVTVSGYDKEQVDKAFSERVAQYHASQPVADA